MSVPAHQYDRPASTHPKALSETLDVSQEEPLIDLTEAGEAKRAELSKLSKLRKESSY